MDEEMDESMQSTIETTNASNKSMAAGESSTSSIDPMTLPPPETTRPKPRNMPWTTPSTPLNKERGGTSGTNGRDLRSIMREQAEERQQLRSADAEEEARHLRIVEEAQEEEMIRLAMELSLSEVGNTSHTTYSEQKSEVGPIREAEPMRRREDTSQASFASRGSVSSVASTSSQRPIADLDVAAPAITSSPDPSLRSSTRSLLNTSQRGSLRGHSSRRLTADSSNTSLRSINSVSSPSPEKAPGVQSVKVDPRVADKVQAIQAMSPRNSSRQLGLNTSSRSIGTPSTTASTEKIPTRPGVQRVVSNRDDPRLADKIRSIEIMSNSSRRLAEAANTSQRSIDTLSSTVESEKPPTSPRGLSTGRQLVVEPTTGWDSSANSARRMQYRKSLSARVGISKEVAGMRLPSDDLELIEDALCKGMQRNAALPLEKEAQWLPRPRFERRTSDPIPQEFSSSSRRLRWSESSPEQLPVENSFERKEGREKYLNDKRPSRGVCQVSPSVGSAPEECIMSRRFDSLGGEEKLSEEDKFRRIQEAMEESPEEIVLLEESSPEVMDAVKSEHISAEEAAEIEKALREADLQEEQKSLALAMQIQEQEESERRSQLAARPQQQGNVRTMTRAQLLAEGSSRADTHPPPDQYSDDEEDEVAGFRMNSAARQQWSRRRDDLIVGPNQELRTKHDAALLGQANAHRLGLEMDDVAGVGNKAYNSFLQSVRRKKKGVATQGTGRAGSDADGTKGGAMDPRVRTQITRAINADLIEKCNGVVKEGKEAIVYHADKGEESEGFDVAIKVFKRIQEFRGRGEYVDGDPRYARTPFRSAGSREQLEMWAEKEYRNLLRANRAGVPVPTPLLYKENIIFMRFLGTDGWPAPQLRELDLRRGSRRWETLYLQILDAVKRLYQQARLVHGDLSEYNVMVVPAYLVENVASGVGNARDEMQAVLIDFGMAVDTKHPEARSLLERDLARVLSFFARQGVTTMTTAEAVMFVQESA